jgi:hypothetical protein
MGWKRCDDDCPYCSSSSYSDVDEVLSRRYQNTVFRGKSTRGRYNPGYAETIAFQVICYDMMPQGTGLETWCLTVAGLGGSVTLIDKARATNARRVG